MAELLFDEGLVSFLSDGESPASVERCLAELLVKRGCVRDSFVASVVERELLYPTGLEAGAHNVAIPHCDAEHTVRPAVCVGVLRPAVAWHRMDDADELCDVELVVMLALSDSHDHLEMIQRVIGLVQDQELIGAVLASNEAAEVASLISPRLLGT